VITGTWVDTRTPIEVTYRAAHACRPYPISVIQGNGFCQECAVNSPPPSGSSANWWALHGGTVIGPWTRCDQSGTLVCTVGHDVTTRSLNVARGDGPCRICAGKVWDAFYVVTSTYSLKFGITSGDPRPRLQNHYQDGYPNVVRLFAGLALGVAKDLETELIAAILTAGHNPVRGREYFSMDALPLVPGIVYEFIATAGIESPEGMAA
jgi:hypothetical protein